MPDGTLTEQMLALTSIESGGRGFSFDGRCLRFTGNGIPNPEQWCAIARMILDHFGVPRILPDPAPAPAPAPAPCADCASRAAWYAEIADGLSVPYCDRETIDQIKNTLMVGK